MRVPVEFIHKTSQLDNSTIDMVMNSHHDELVITRSEIKVLELLYLLDLNDIVLAVWLDALSSIPDHFKITPNTEKLIILRQIGLKRALRWVINNEK